jgi:hypothetical protein
MPAVVELIRRMGGLDEIPEVTAASLGMHNTIDVPEVKIHVRDGDYWEAMLKRRDSGQVLIAMSRFGESGLQVTHWHPHNADLTIVFRLPADWTAWAWTVEVVMIHDTLSTTLELDALATEACDMLAGLVNDPNKSYCHTRRDLFVF